MTVEQREIIDLVGLEPDGQTVVLSLVEDRPWGTRGELLPDLQAKLSTYLAYALDGQLVADYPVAAGSRVRFRLHYAHPPGDREMQFIALVRKQFLDPEAIEWQQGPLAT